MKKSDLKVSTLAVNILVLTASFLIIWGKALAYEDLEVILLFFLIKSIGGLVLNLRHDDSLNNHKAQR